MHRDGGQIRGKRLHQRFTFTSHLPRLMLFKIKLSQAICLPHGNMLIHISCVCVSEGEMTGVCVNSTMTCEVLAWCPIENDGNIPE